MILSDQLLWLSLLLVLLLLLPLLLLFLIQKENGHLPPAPPGLPIIGNLHQIGKLPHQSLWQLSKKYGPVMLLRFGCVPAVVISSAEAAEEALKIHDLSCCSRPPLAALGRLSYNYLDIGFAPYGPYWREIRKLCTLQLFSAKKVQSFRLIRKEEVASLINSITQCKNGPVDLTEKFMTLSANETLRMAFGTTFEHAEFDKKRFKELIYDAEVLLGSFSASDYFGYFGRVFDRIRGYYSRTERIFNQLDAFYRWIIDDHLKPEMTDNKGPADIVDVLLRMEKEQSGVGSVQLKKDHIKAVLMDIFLAGVSTGSSSLIWAMAELARHPGVMKKAQQEVRDALGNKERVTEDDIDELKYLKMVVKESLRLHPPVPLLLPRQSISQFKIHGYEIYPKTQIHVNVWAIGRDPKCWKDPEEFNPERFVDSSIDFKGQHFELLPFGAGRRICPGLSMGTTLLELVLANLLYFFDWKLPDGVEDINMEELNSPCLALFKSEPLLLVPVLHIQ